MTHRGPHFLFLQGAHESGTLFRFRTTRYCPSGELLVVVAEGGVGGIVLDAQTIRMLWKGGLIDRTRVFYLGENMELFAIGSGC